MTKWLLTSTILIALHANSQTGGTNAFPFLNLSYNARSAGLGGDFITVRDKDISSGLQNPALLYNEMDGQGSISQALLAGGINFGSLNYAKSFRNFTTAAQFKYVSYGKMQRTDVTGANTGTFSPGDFALGVSASKSINERLHIGATLNFLYSQLDSYTAFGNSLDIGGAYINDDKLFNVTGVIKNIGVQWKGYTTDKRDPLPIELQLGISKKLEHAPFRFSLVGQQLQRWDLTYSDPNERPRVDPLTGDTIQVKGAGFFGKLARHTIIQTELIFGKRLHLRVGFDYLRRSELRVESRPGAAGFSFGLGLYFKRFTLDYGLTAYSAAGYQNQFTLTIPFSRKP